MDTKPDLDVTIFPPDEEINGTADLRRFLINQLRRVVSGELEVARSRAASNMAQQVYNIHMLEIRVAALRAKEGELQIKSIPFDHSSEKKK